MFSGKLCDDKLAKELDADFQEIQESSVRQFFYSKSICVNA